MGEVYDDMFMIFDHSWIELDSKIIDLACAMTLQDNGKPASAPVVLILIPIQAINISLNMVYLRRGSDLRQCVLKIVLSLIMLTVIRN